VSRTETLRKRCRELLEQKAVVIVVGWRETSKGTAQPAFITAPDQADTLVFDERCGQNIANYLPKVKHQGKVAVVAKGCDSRSISSLIKERQLDRSQLLILGVGCEGIKEGGQLSDSCATCACPNPVVFDEMVGESVPVRKPESDPLAEFEKLSADERWLQLSEDVSRCIRCYACRQTCPNCYCPVCFVDSNAPQWVGKTPHLSDNMVFHLMRALHMAGRCVECGACHRACPMGIDLMKFNRKVAKIVKDRFGTTAGTNPDEPVALTAFNPDDKQEFVK
jgi:formate dehydrogenase subunit beta